MGGLRLVRTPAAREQILRCAEQVLGARPELAVTSATASGTQGRAKIATLAGVEQEGRKQRHAERRQAALSHPRVRDAIEVFGESESNVDVQVDTE